MRPGRPVRTLRFAVVFTCACYYQDGQWVIDAYATHRCWMNYCEVN